MSNKRTTIQDIEHIRSTYIREKSIHKTSKITGWAPNTVLKYIPDLSRQHPSSKYSNRTVIQVDKNNVVTKHKNLTEAAKNSGISISNIDHCLIGNTKSAGGYKWYYDDDFKKVQ